MTIPAVTAGQIIDPTTFGNAVADKLNNMPDAIVAGTASVTNVAGNSPSIPFGVTFTAAPIVSVTVVALGTGQEWTTAVRALSTTAFELRTYLNGAAHAGAVSFHWIAFGEI